MPNIIGCSDLYAQLGLPSAPLILDVRTEAERERQPLLIPGALRVGEDPSTLVESHLRARKSVVYCDDGSGRGNALAERLGRLGVTANILEGGLNAWRARELPTVKIRHEYLHPGGSRWITRERPKIDRLACPWLVRRFIDPQAQFFYTAPERVRADTQALEAEPFDIADVTFSHRGDSCSFDAFLFEFELKDRTLDALATIVRAADTATLDHSREAAGLLAISIGLGANEGNDIVLLEQAMSIYDALYAWCKRGPRERHAWPKGLNSR